MILKIYRGVQIFILALIVAVVVGMFSLVTVLDMKPYVVVSGSMEPELPVGSICLIDSADKEPKAGEIISFKAGDAVVTHRVVTVTDEGYVTKGDANDGVDPGIVKSEQIVGTYAADIPYAGYAVMFLRTMKGIILTMTFVTCFTLFGLLLERRREY